MNESLQSEKSLYTTYDTYLGSSADREMENSLHWVNNFWGPDDVGYQRLMQRMHHAKQTLEEVQHFFKERVQIEQEYSKRLLAHSRRPVGSHEIGAIKNGFESLRANTQTMAVTHENTSRIIYEQVLQPLEKFSGALRDRRKTVEDTMAQLTKARAHQNSITERDRIKFKSECNKIKGYQAQQNLLTGRELEKNNQKLDKAQFQVETLERHHQESLKALASAMDTWNAEWRISCDCLEQLEGERLAFLKSRVWSFVNALDAGFIADDEACEGIRVSLDKYDPVPDLQLFAKKAGTGNKIQNPPEFVNFLKGFSKDSDEATFHPVNFRSALDDTNVTDLSVPSPSFNSLHASHASQTSQAPTRIDPSPLLNSSEAQGNLSIDSITPNNSTPQESSKRRTWNLPFRRNNHSQGEPHQSHIMSNNSIEHSQPQSQPHPYTLDPAGSASPIDRMVDRSADSNFASNAGSPPSNFAKETRVPNSQGSDSNTPIKDHQAPKNNTKHRPYSYVQPTEQHFSALDTFGTGSNKDMSVTSNNSKMTSQSSWAKELGSDDPLVAALESLKSSPIRARPKSSYVPSKSSWSPPAARGQQTQMPSGNTSSSAPNSLKEMNPTGTPFALNSAASTTRRTVQRKEVGSMANLPMETSDGQPVIKHVVAMYDYRAAIPEELSFRKGDILLVTEMQEDGWWFCEINGTDKFGLAPHNFLHGV